MHQVLPFALFVGTAMSVTAFPVLARILTDRNMEALRRLRESSRTADIPVVAVTAQAMKQDRERALDAGFNGYVEKPISVRAFPDQVRRFLSGGEVGTE